MEQHKDSAAEKQSSSDTPSKTCWQSRNYFSTSSNSCWDFQKEKKKTNPKLQQQQKKDITMKSDMCSPFLPTLANNLDKLYHDSSAKKQATKIAFPF